MENDMLLDLAAKIYCARVLAAALRTPVADKTDDAKEAVEGAKALVRAYLEQPPLYLVEEAKLFD